jgi:hypothetical protein
MLETLYPTGTCLFLGKDRLLKWEDGSKILKTFQPKVLIVNLIPEYTDDQAIEALIQDTAISTKRGMEKANEWLAKLKTQDVMTVGDLRDLQEEDWTSL